tara:strand:- start:3960 stop:4307 length:348 start_codon:yes stop_codon:yes gene_type:complete
MNTQKLFDSTVAVSSAVGSTFVPPMVKGNRGVVDFKLKATTGGSGTSRVTIRLQGRLSENQDWVDVMLDDTSWYCELGTSLPGLTFQDIQLFPEMRANISAQNFTSATILVLLGH